NLAMSVRDSLPESYLWSHYVFLSIPDDLALTTGFQVAIDTKMCRSGGRNIVPGRSSDRFSICRQFLWKQHPQV
ncbi:MAG: hypothetical protein U1F83_15625, partial [Verrucomicrobiota bacterium]